MNTSYKLGLQGEAIAAAFLEQKDTGLLNGITAMAEQKLT